MIASDVSNTALWLVLSALLAALAAVIIRQQTRWGKRTVIPLSWMALGAMVAAFLTTGAVVFFKVFSLKLSAVVFFFFAAWAAVLAVGIVCEPAVQRALRNGARPSRQMAQVVSVSAIGGIIMSALWYAIGDTPVWGAQAAHVSRPPTSREATLGLKEITSGPFPGGGVAVTVGVSCLIIAIISVLLALYGRGRAAQNWREQRRLSLWWATLQLSVALPIALMNFIGAVALTRLQRLLTGGLLWIVAVLFLLLALWPIASVLMRWDKPQPRGTTAASNRPTSSAGRHKQGGIAQSRGPAPAAGPGRAAGPETGTPQR